MHGGCGTQSFRPPAICAQAAVTLTGVSSLVSFELQSMICCKAFGCCLLLPTISIKYSFGGCGWNDMHS
jgi:hypothetical protein